MRECSKCHRDNVEFHRNAGTKDGLQSICKQCQKLRNQNRKNQIRQAIMDILRSQQCIDCGETDPVVLDFDHRSSDEKVSDISGMTRHGYTFEKIKVEIDKCDIRCANCHRRRTAKQFGWNKDINIERLI